MDFHTLRFLNRASIIKVNIKIIVKNHEFLG